MRRTLTITSLAAAALAIGCVSGDRVRVYDGPPRDPATVSVVRNNADAMVTHVDGRPVHNGLAISSVADRHYELTPGRHRLRVTSVWGGSSAGGDAAEIECDLVAGRTYGFLVNEIAGRLAGANVPPRDVVLVELPSGKLVARPAVPLDDGGFNANGGRR